MKTTIVTGFEVVMADGDGRGETHQAYFSDQTAAEMLVSQSPGWMRMYPFTKTTVVYDTFSEYVTAKADAFKAKALAKLTKEEREALGV